MATVSTVPADLVSASASSSAGLLRYDSILADACAFNRRLRKGRVERPAFFDTATQIAQRPAPWLHRTAQARTKGLPFSKPHFLVTYRRHRWRLQPGHKRRFADSLETSRLLFMFQAIPFPSPPVAVESSTSRGPNSRSQVPTNDYIKQQLPQVPLGISSTDPEASLPGSVSGDGSCQSPATQNSTNNSTTASNGGERRILAADSQQQPQASPCVEDLSGQRFDSYGRYTEEEEGERSKFKFRRRFVGLGEKSGVVRRYHKRLGVGVYGRPRGKRGIPGRCDSSSRWSSLDGSIGGLQVPDGAYTEDSPDSYTPPEEAIYRSNANLSTVGLTDGLSKSPHSHPGFMDTPELIEDPIIPRSETPTGSKIHSQQQSGSSAPPQPPSSILQHYHLQTITCGADKRTQPEGAQEPGNVDWRNSGLRHPHSTGPDDAVSSDLSHSSTSPSGRPVMPNHQPSHNPVYNYHPSPLSTPTSHRQQPPPPLPSVQSNAQPPPPAPPPPPPPLPPPPPSSTSASGPLDMNSIQGGGAVGNSRGSIGTPPPPGSSSGSSEPTTVVTFFVCEVCASRYRSTAGLRYHYHSQHAGYTPRNPISASASRISIPTSEYNRFAPNSGPRGGRNGRTKRSRS
uniref:C2H2-type domain-containing protein n=1 Tax=Mesocestoides corti TaxID=53468 RepID=A0A5K3FV21_MESCO